MKSHGYAAHDKTSALVPFKFERRDPGPNDVVVEIAYCGICHSDIHQVRDEWKNAIYPMVPGHEIVGRVTKVGSAVKKFKEGDLAGVGVMVIRAGFARIARRAKRLTARRGWWGLITLEIITGS